MSNSLALSKNPKKSLFKKKQRTPTCKLPCQLASQGCRTYLWSKGNPKSRPQMSKSKMFSHCQSYFFSPVCSGLPRCLSSLSLWFTSWCFGVCKPEAAFGLCFPASRQPRLLGNRETPVCAHALCGSSPHFLFPTCEKVLTCPS